ncbi:plastocyanin/azurin family copper-binding protein [Iamia sp.]|uniref:plastocyanin/azurin family copper-binding protein n=1 Tax=Iamia sp. TaxID=2722710 RepID=UPI002C872F7B|nr:plastocyanin/azurin family copper-binding protein [Iamia sp.]HXH58626.1 plastocyanin/azurin family copper-binding protein [Iamia sp.]
MTRLATALAALVVGGAVTGGGYAVAAADDEAAEPVRGPGTTTVTVTIRDSRFSPEVIRVWEGTQVRFVVRNRDPLNHELVVGPDAVHLRHTDGTEAAHPPVPGEVSLGPGQTGATVYDFDEPGTVRMVCHLPRHEDYGMVGAVEVVPRPG